MSDIKTKFKNAITVVSADFANSIYGGLSGSTEGQFLPDNDPRILGHIHDGQNKDGHAGKIDLVDNVKGQIRNTNISDGAITKRNIFTSMQQDFAIPEFDVVNGENYYYLDLSDLRSEISTGLVSLSDENPLSLGVADPGIGTTASRSDHVHEMPSLSDLQDTNIGILSDQDIIVYDLLTSKWVSTAFPTFWPTTVSTDVNGRVYEQALAEGINSSIILTPTGTGTIQSSVADNLVTGGDQRGNYSVDLQLSRSSSIHVASGQNSVLVGGADNSAAGSYSSVVGGYGASAELYGMRAEASGYFSEPGDSQFGRVIFRTVSSGDAPVILTADGGVGSATTRFTIPIDSTVSFEINATAVEPTTSDSKHWHIRGGIKRDLLNNTSLIGANNVFAGSDMGASAWTLTATADDLTESLQLEAVGEINKTIRWTATVFFTRITY